jgi:hypothetical protein
MINAANNEGNFGGRLFILRLPLGYGYSARELFVAILRQSTVTS